MKLLNKSLKVLLLSSCLMTLSDAVTESVPLDDFLTLADKFSTTAETSKAVEVKTVVGSGLDKGLMGTVTATNESYIFLDSSNKLKAMAIIGGKWCTFESGVLSAISATGQIDLAQTKADGASTTTNKLTINLTRASGAALTPAAINTWLKTALTTTAKTFGLGALKTLSAPAAGWTATALVQASSGSSNVALDAIAAVLDPIAFTLTVPVTPAAGGTAVNYSYALTDVSSYNVVASTGSVVGGADVVALVNSTAAGNTLTLKLKPQLILTPQRTPGIMAGLVTDANALTQRRLKVTSPYTYPTLAALASNLDAVIVSLGGSDGDTLGAVTNSAAKDYVLSDNFTTADLAAGDIIETSKYGLVAMTATNITSMSGWSTAPTDTGTGTKIKVTGTVSGVAKEFSCVIPTGVNTFKNAAESPTSKKVFQFTSADGDVFWIKAFDTTGLDASTLTTAALQDDYLALLIADKVSGVTSITAKTLAQLKTAAAS